MEQEMLGLVTQFGVAGLIGWMWLSERRSGAAREQQIGEAHEMVMRERQKVDVLVSALEQNTRAMTAVEVGQRHLSALLAAMSAARGDGKREGAEAA